MKYLLLGGLFSVFMLAPHPAQAQSPITFTFDENCNGHFNSGGASGPLPCGLLTDPGPGGLAGAVTYDLENPPGLVAGDLLLIEPSTDGIVEDIVRFNPTQVGSGGGTGTIVFYSDTIGGPDALGDIGLPTSIYTNALRISEVGPEGNNGATYTPTAGQPGFIAGVGPVVTYVIQSDTSPTPEPASIALMLGGAGLLFARKYWIKRVR